MKAYQRRHREPTASSVHSERPTLSEQDRRGRRSPASFERESHLQLKPPAPHQDPTPTPPKEETPAQRQQGRGRQTSKGKVASAALSTCRRRHQVVGSVDPRGAKSRCSAPAPDPPLPPTHHRLEHPRSHLRPAAAHRQPRPQNWSTTTVAKTATTPRSTHTPPVPQIGGRKTPLWTQRRQKQHQAEGEAADYLP